MNPFKPHLGNARPAPRGLIKRANRGSPAPAPDADVLAAIVSRRLAMRFGLTAPIAAAVAALNGLGPQSGRTDR